MRPKSTLVHFLALAGSSLLAICSASAATYYWDNNGTTAGYGTASGTWASPTTGDSTQGWTTANNGTTLPTNNITTLTTDTVNFGNGANGLGAGTITVSGTVATGGITFASGSGAIVLSGGTINLAAASTITTNNSSDTISSILSGAATSLTKAGTGTLVLTDANTYTGATIISGGTLDLGGSGTTGSLASTVLTLSGGNFSFTRSDSAPQSFTTTNINSIGASQISVVAGNTLNLGTVTRGTGVAFDFTNTGSGTVAASTASNTDGIMAGFSFGDTWAVANGTGNAITGLANGSYTATTGLATNAYAGNIDVDSSDATPDAGITVNSLRFSEGAANTLTLSGTNTITTGGILIGSGVGGNLSTITGGTLRGAASKDLSIIQNNTSGGLTISSVIANNGGATGLAKSGAGLLTLFGNNTFTGATVLYGGTTRFSGTMGASAITINNNAVVQLGATTGLSSSNSVTFGAGATGGLQLLGNSVTIGALSSNATVGTPVITNNNGGGPVANATLTIDSASSTTFAGVIQDGTGGGALSLTKSGAGTLILSGTNNTYSGTTTLTAGTLRGSDTTNSLTPVSPFGSSSLSLNAGTLELKGEGTPNNNVETITFGNNTTVGGDTTINVARFGATSNNKIIALGTLSIGENTLNVTAGTAYSLAFGATTLTGNAVFNTSTGGLFLGSITESGGSYSLTKNGSSALQINGNTSHTGATTISAGNLQLGNGGTTGSLSNTSSFSINGTLTVNRSNAFTQAADLNGHALTGSASFTQAGTGTTTLSLTNTYTGATAVTAGTLSINSIANYGTDSAIGKGTAGTSIILGGANIGAATGTLEYTGGAQSTDRTIQVGSQNQNTTGGARIINNGTGALTFTAAIFNPAYAQNNTNTRNLTLGGTNGGTINGTIQNISTSMRVGLIKVGSGTWTLGGINTYTGDNTDVHAGTLRLQSGATTITQTLRALRFQVADGTLASNKTGAGDLSTTFTSVARAAGATGNFVSAGGTNGTDNSVNITGTAGFLNAGLYFGGSEFAARNGTDGYVRALAYGSDTNAVAVDTITAGRHVKLTASPGSNQNNVTLLSLNLQGSGVNWTNNSGQSLTSPGILKSGGGSSLISGGNVSAGGNNELVVRTDLATDNLTISSNLIIGSGALTKSGAGTLTLSGTNTYTGQTHVNAGTLSIGANGHLGAEATGATLNLKGGTLQATGTFGLFNGTAGTNNRAVTLLDQSGIEVTASNTLTIAGVISNNANAVNAPGFNKTGTGTLAVSGVNTYTGATNVNAGTLLVSGAGSMNSTSAINVAAGARFANNSSVALTSAPTLGGNGTGSRAVYGGTGTLNAALTLDNVGDVLSPGNSPGIMSFGANQSWGSYSYDWELNDWAAKVAGTNIDQINITGSLTLAGATPGSYILNVLSLTGGDVTGNVPNFADVNNSWTILTTTTGISGFSADYWTINAAGFTTSPTATGSWSVAQSGNDLVLNFVAVPEPAPIVLVASGGAIVGSLLARRRRGS